MDFHLPSFGVTNCAGCAVLEEKKVEIDGTLERKNTAIRVDSIKALD
jgi:hypothetical protein